MPLRILLLVEAEECDFSVSNFEFHKQNISQSFFIDKSDVWVGDLKVLPSVYDKTYRLISVDASGKIQVFDLINLFLIDVFF